MPKRAPLDLNQFKIELPKPMRDPLDSIIPTTPPLPPAVARIEPVVSETAKTRNRDKMKRRTGEKAKKPKSETAKTPQDRAKVRQGFDVYRDQIFALNQIQFELYTRTGKKPKVGAFVRTAIDEFVAKQKRELGNLK